MKLFFVTTGGGLGNQIMSYALWLYLKKSGYRTVFYLRKNHLERIFDKKELFRLLHIHNKAVG